MKTLSILGSTGSIGTNALDVIARDETGFSVIGLAGHNNIELLRNQIERFRPKAAVVADEEKAAALIDILGASSKTSVLFGLEGYRELAVMKDADMVISAMSGAAGLLPTMDAVEAGRDIALANKETMVMAGELVLEKARSRGVRILPVDSEHSAIFQCLEGHPKRGVRKLVLTASGGPFFQRDAVDLETVTPREALRHPNWRMGSKITIDSATMMNKGLEIIEAMHLFAMDVNLIEVVIHPQSIVHSMVVYRDGSVLAQMGIPDMRIPIAYAIAYPERMDLALPELDLTAAGTLTFIQPDCKKFPCMRIAGEAARKGGTAPAVLNAANEIAVDAFLAERLRFTDIPVIAEETLRAHDGSGTFSLEAVLAADQWARDHATKCVDTMQNAGSPRMKEGGSATAREYGSNDDSGRKV
jgi:1-deoxy-D-xylulose-5-phosphate reductoisomerase